MKILADRVRRWMKTLERQDPEAYAEVLAYIEGFEVAEDAFCAARDELVVTMQAAGFPARGLRGDGVRENIERVERYMKGGGYIRPARPRGRPFGMRCPSGPSGLVEASPPGTMMEMPLGDDYEPNADPYSPFPSDDEEEEVMVCEACRGPLVELGTLGRRTHYHCRDCGMEHSHVHEPPGR